MIAPSFADIFFNNCFKNGLLPIVLDAQIVDRLFRAMFANEGYQLTIDLPNQQIITPEGEKIAFEVGSFSKHCLLNGLDDIDITLQDENEIHAFEKKWRQQAPWLFAQQ